MKNIALFLPRPKPDNYRGGMPLDCEEALIKIAKEILTDRIYCKEVKDELCKNCKFNSQDLKILNLFSGMTKYGVRVDLNPKVNPDYLLDAHICSKELLEKEGKFDIIIADPPYSNKEAWELYPNVQLPKLDYKVWTYECEKLLNDSGVLIVYHKYIMPNPNWAVFKVVKRVFIGTRTYHIPRVAIYFQYKELK